MLIDCWMLSVSCSLSLALTLGLSGFTALMAQTPEAELAAKALNPISDMISVPFQNNFNFAVGPDHVSQYVLNVQPIVPIRLNDRWNLITRTIIPIFVNPSGTGQDPESGLGDVNPAGPGQPPVSGLGDINPTVFLSPVPKGGSFWGFGPAFTVPTGTSSQLTTGQFSIGPSVAYMISPKPWLFSVVANQQWSVGGRTNKRVSATFIMPMLMYFLPHGWYLGSSPIITADWEAKSGNRWLVPIGGGVGKMAKLGNQRMNIQLQPYYNVEKPDKAPNWQLRFQVQLLYPK